MRYSSEHKPLTRIRVLQSAARQMRERGAERLAVAAVMAEAGLTHGGFYAHFKSRDELLRATVEYMFAASPFTQLRDSALAPQQALRGFVNQYLSPAHRDTHRGGCPLPLLMADAPRLAVDIRICLAAAVNTLGEQIAQHLRALGTADADSLAASCVAEMIGAMILARAETDTTLADVTLARSRCAILSRLHLEISA